MMQLPAPEDFVIATGESRSVREFAEAAFAELGVALEWRGAGQEEEGVVAAVDPAVLGQALLADGGTGGRGDGGKESERRTSNVERRTPSGDLQAEHRTSNIEHRTSNSEPKSEVRSPMSAPPESNHEPHEPHELDSNPHSAIRNPHSENPQSAIRNPQLESPAPSSEIRSPMSEVRLPQLGDVVVRIDPKYFRPAEVDNLLGDASKARAMLGWEPTVHFAGLVREMVRHDLAEAVRDLHLMRGGFSVRRAGE
jgi:GDP-D-mannose dehydratase